MVYLILSILVHILTISLYEISSTAVCKSYIPEGAQYLNRNSD